MGADQAERSWDAIREYLLPGDLEYVAEAPARVPEWVVGPVRSHGHGCLRRISDRYLPATRG